eukprot:CAMPEP_0202021182 /NCGR_PEP_ID=MMETSP0905-20130828/46319_1 /ASSEMBLY_ACC=CAM_ASM_000554 /TAXON_ID=420261 /ORGANISM="Thalassiosira antarctica, Strain CCMP982" /LENGTH=470 /DNA_ID=CAMNT_0048582983 /DNA_START=230 /DNA_END=1642 /DNA_ORIENTATION=+
MPTQVSPVNATDTDRNSNNDITAAVVSIGGTLALSALVYYANRFQRSRWMSEEERAHGHDTTHSVIDHFKSLILDPETTVEEANKRRTTSYYLKMRESHSKSLVLGVGGPLVATLVKLREREVERALQYWRRGNQSHRTIVVMCDETTRRVLADARRQILEPLKHSSDIHTRGAWIPPLNIIPEQDMHISIALPWWWHTIRQGNDELTRNMAQRFKQTLLLKFHYPFQIELERIILLGGKVIVALWRCVGDRTTENGRVIHDRHGEHIDPMVRLREEIIRCFITESPDQRRKPLTYQHRMNDGMMDSKEEFLERQHTIKRRTPGMGVTADGFIHTTLCRLPLECLSSHDIELEEIHRLCREASATLNGHRMVISNYRFLETMGEGGESNPCYKPLYDETIDAPLRHTVGIDGTVTERKILQSHTVNEHLTIGHVRNFEGQAGAADAVDDSREKNEKRNANALSELFQPPE